VALKTANSGSVYYNYKGFFSVVLMGVVDAHYRFIYVNVGSTGAESDGGVFLKTKLRDLLDDNELGLPDDEPIQAGGRPVSYFIVGDEAFPLRTWLMKPVPKRNLNEAERL
jgi:hypothetical protein